MLTVVGSPTVTHSPPVEGREVPPIPEITILSKQAFKDENEINSHVKMIEDANKVSNKKERMRELENWLNLIN